MDLAERFADTTPDPFWEPPPAPRAAFAEWVGEPGLARLWREAQRLAGAVGVRIGQDLMAPGPRARHWARAAGCLAEAAGKSADKVSALADDARREFGWGHEQMARWTEVALAFRCEPLLRGQGRAAPESDAILGWLARRAPWGEMGPGARALFARCAGESAAAGAGGLVDVLGKAGCSWDRQMVSSLVLHGARSIHRGVVVSAASGHRQNALSAEAVRALDRAGAEPAGEDVFFAWAGKCDPLAEELLRAGADLSGVERLPEALERAWALARASRRGAGPASAERDLRARATSAWEAHALAALSAGARAPALPARRL